MTIDIVSAILFLTGGSGFLIGSALCLWSMTLTKRPSEQEFPLLPVHDVSWMQERLGVTADGKVGPVTIDAMIKFIEAH